MQDLEEFLVSLVVGRRDLPKKFASVYEQLRSCGAIAKDSALHRLSPAFIIARIHKNKGGVFAHNIASPKAKGLRLGRGRNGASTLANGDIALLLIRSKDPRIIKVLNRHSTPASRLVCLAQKKGKIIGIDCKSLESIPLPFSQKSLRALPKHCVLAYQGTEITKILGSLLDPRIDEHIILDKYNFASDFSQQAKEFAKSFGIVDVGYYTDRVDLCDKPFITIDPSDAKDHDDAVFWEQDSHTLYIAIADVSEYVAPNTELDMQARSRCFSLYFPHICYPMLPNTLSQSLCSLRANEPKLALVWEIVLHKRTKLPRSARLYEAVITPRANISYEQAQGILDSSGESELAWLRDLYSNTQKLKAKRLESGYDFMSVDRAMRLDTQGAIESIHIHTACPSHSLIEEAMLLANILSAQVLADLCEEGGIYRAHEPPSDERIYALLSQAKELGYTIPKGDFHAQIQALQKDALKRGENAREQLDTLIIKSQKEARYTDKREAHFGLGFAAYTHFTSPIRRYSDLIAHRLLKTLMRDFPKRTITLQRGVSLASKTRKQIAYILESSGAIIPLLNEKERQIARAEAEFKDRKYTRLASGLVGECVGVRVVDERYPALGVICAGDFNVGDSALLKKHRLSPSGIPCFKATADPKSSSALKSIKSPTSNTAIPRILEEEKHALCEKLAAIDKQAQALESTFLNCGQEIQKMDSRENVDCHADKSAHNDNKNAICEKVDSSKQAHFLSSRALRQQSVAIHTHNAQDTSLESTFDNPNAKTQKVDSRKNARKNAQSIESSNAKKNPALLQGARVVITQAPCELMRDELYTAVIERVDLIAAKIYVQIP
ncbi:RNB domain-containing ribonuclease [Helicobacter zhangjianzhongii]|uniref:Ribonuclease R n=1 Tax=Helicobacter zhangjianzhongii TaxID=2974574 RepID=A0ACC6FQ36_9HELI|nr:MULTISPECIES: ribonuclease R family protein [unclassified Helicobacter]MDL0079240.1 ribonuclease R [Helicobacter sp. CPD2-1]MDL0081269.1 ribonuclease R [Helicobacter sp. XJK30-2]